MGHLAEGKADLGNAGTHLSPAEFHRMLLESVASPGPGGGGDEGGAKSRGTVLLDCRNLYETRIGRFELVRVGGVWWSGRNARVMTSSCVLCICSSFRNVSGKFPTSLSKEGLPRTDPLTRCFSDLPAWMDRMEDALRGKRVFM